MATHGHALQKRFCAGSGLLCTHPSAQKAVAKKESQSVTESILVVSGSGGTPGLLRTLQI